MSGPAPTGRPRSTSRDQVQDVALALFVRDGFEETTVDDIAAAVGVTRRTLFRYFASKNDIVWGEFDRELERFAAELRKSPADEPLFAGVRRAIVAFNSWPADGDESIRARMELITSVPALQAHSAIRYADWCRVVQDHVGERLGVGPDDLLPETIASTALGTAMASYRYWVSHGGELLTHLERALDLLGAGFSDEALGLAPPAAG
ncbi:mycofactocin system transcriptional regulator [Patulibacter minatonensis]|uniref:mycofactocin system transcriptional regulator n=1 Tax=Patulibacter minatonensis TaxID=298163 RepID=UPI00047D3EEC|nr:mycofactocin system transcriptional regulator [Patulibacter minatonensis]